MEYKRVHTFPKSPKVNVTAWLEFELALFDVAIHYCPGLKRKYYINRSYLPSPSARVGYDTRSIFKRILTGLNSEFSFS